MKLNLNEWKTSAEQFVSYLRQAAIINFNLTKRFITLVLITALFMPIIYLADWQKASAQSSSLISQISQPIAAPAEQYVLSGSNGIPATTLSAVSSINALVVGGYSSVANFFTPAPLPVGFEGATTISPASAALASVSTSISSFPGFFLPSLMADSTTNNNNEAAEPNTLPFHAAGTVKFDFDGDGKADISRWRSSLKQ